MGTSFGNQQESQRAAMGVNQHSSLAATSLRDERVSSFLRSVYAWMFVGLGITAVTAYVVASTPIIMDAIAANPSMIWIFFIAQIGLVLFLSVKVNSLAPTTAAALFIVYSVLTGVTSSIILLVYTGASVVATFIITAGMFGAMAVFGTVTKRSLAGVGQFFFMGLIGLILASIVGIFVQSAALQFVISVVGVLVFTGLTAWDAQRLKQMATSLPADRVGSYAILGALSLYLDFINLFFYLLRFTGRRD
jgi:FtsH-binding integral membrane protein